MTCPKCKSRDAHRVLREGPRDALANWLLMKPYLCPSCANRFHVIPKGGGHPPLLEQFELRMAEARRGKAGRWLRRTGLLTYLLAIVLFALLFAVVLRFLPGAQ